MGTSVWQHYCYFSFFVESEQSNEKGHDGVTVEMLLLYWWGDKGLETDCWIGKVYMYFDYSDLSFTLNRYFQIKFMALECCFIQLQEQC